MRPACGLMASKTARTFARAALRELDTPSFVCTGACDVWSTEDVTRELVGCLRSPRTLTLPDVGHLPNLERPLAFNKSLGDFLDEAWRARG